MTERRRFVESGKEEMGLKTRMDKETVGVEDGDLFCLAFMELLLSLNVYLEFRP